MEEEEITDVEDQGEIGAVSTAGNQDTLLFIVMSNQTQEIEAGRKTNNQAEDEGRRGEGEPIQPGRWDHLPRETEEEKQKEVVGKKKQGK